MLSMQPVLIYAKNAIGRKFLAPGSYFYNLLDQQLRHLFAYLEMDYIDLLGEEDVFSFDRFPRYVNNFCR